MNEHAVVFGSSGSLTGIVTEAVPAAARSQRPGMIFLNGGLLHHVGPNRLHVKLGRRLAAAGHCVLRFDFSGTGDSGVRRDHSPREQSLVLETQDAIDWMQETYGIQEFILLGVCSGAVAAVSAACEDSRVGGAVLINPRPQSRQLLAAHAGRSAIRKYGTLARTRPLTFLTAILSRASLSGWRNLLETVRSAGRPRTTPADTSTGEAELANRWRALAVRGVRLLLLYSEWDPGLDYVQTLPASVKRDLLDHEEIDLRVIANTNHTFMQLRKQQELSDLIAGWVQRRSADRSDERLRKVCR